MKRIKTFITGAGASKEFDLPTGGELVKEIEQLCNFRIDQFGRISSGDRVLARCFELAKSKTGERWNSAYLADVANKLRKNMGLAPSIDNFLGAHIEKDGWSDVGKLAIARAILKAERNSSLWFDSGNIYNNPDFSTLPPNWLTELFRTLVSRRGLDEFKAALDSCRFITFNYDRTIEQFFHQAIKSYFDIDGYEVDGICSEHLNVIHVYGSLGPVSCDGSSSFGNSEDDRHVGAAAKRIKVFTEGAPDDADLLRAKSWIRTTEVLVVLGFGFLPLNLRVLAPEPEEEKYPLHTWLMTSKGVAPKNLEIARTVLRNEWYGGRDYTLPFEDSFANEMIWRNSFFLSEADV